MGVVIYPLIYTLLPNPRWLHNAALSYVGIVLLGAYMWQHKLNWVKMGSKWALLSRLSTPNGPRSFLEKHIFDPFFTRFGSLNGPFSNFSGTLKGPRIHPCQGPTRCDLNRGGMRRIAIVQSYLCNLTQQPQSILWNLDATVDNTPR